MGVGPAALTEYGRREPTALTVDVGMGGRNGAVTTAVGLVRALFGADGRLGTKRWCCVGCRRGTTRCTTAGGIRRSVLPTRMRTPAGTTGCSEVFSAGPVTDPCSGGVRAS
jgi:hypothetical protein